MASQKVLTGIAALVLNVLGRALCTAQRCDQRVQNEIEHFPENYSVRISAGKSGATLCLLKKGRMIYPVAELKQAVVDICFKSLHTAMPVLLGKSSVAKAYAEHSFSLQGDISQAMRLVRCIDIAEAYLFPSFLTEKIFDKVPAKEVASIRIYAGLLFQLKQKR